MTRSQVNEGFRRIGCVVAGICTLLTIVLVAVLTKPFASRGSLWEFAMWAAIVTPATGYIGYRIAQLFGWVIAGFVPVDQPAANEHNESAEEPFGAILVLFTAWVAAWLAADSAGDLIGDLPILALSWAQNEADLGLQTRLLLASIAQTIEPLADNVPWYLLFPVRLIIFVFTFYFVLLGVMFLFFCAHQLIIRLREN